MSKEIQLDLFDVFTPSAGVHKGPPSSALPIQNNGGTGSVPSQISPKADDTEIVPPDQNDFRKGVPPLPDFALQAQRPLSEEIVFERSVRATHYRLTLRRDGTAVATIPARGSEREARRFVAEHTDWLVRARARQAQRPRGAEVWTVGTQILWRGEMSPIRIAASSSAARPVIALGALVPNTSMLVDEFRISNLTADMRPTLEAHFLRIAKIELPARTWELASETRVPVTEVTVRNQRTRWGSCTTGGVISLNWRLVQTPFFVRDYIIYHELMHLREMNHSSRFWERVGEVCPSWREAERWIKQNGGLLGL